MGVKTYKLLQYDVDTPNVPVLITVSAAQISDLVAIAADTGWAANTATGDKTVVLTTYVNNLAGGAVTAINLVSAGAGDALSAALDTIVLLVKKVAALETALVASKLPNA